MASPPPSLLGLNYTEWAIPGVYPSQIAADSAGELFILGCPGTAPSPSCVTKLSADGKTILWQITLGFPAAMAVDPSGAVYLVSATFDEPTAFVEKLSADGSTVLWKTQLDVLMGTNDASGVPPAIAVDSTGRTFVTGYGLNGSVAGDYVIRLNAAGTVDYSTSLDGLQPKPAAIAVDPTGSYVSVVTLASALAQLSPGNAAWVYSTVTPVGTASTLNLAVAPNGDTVLYSADSNGNWSLERVHPTGTVVFSQATPSSGQTLGVPVQLGLGLDAAGNAYVTGFNGTLMHPVLDSLASCGQAWLSVYAPDGTLVQSTYIPGAAGTVPGGGAEFWALIAASANSTVYVLDSAGATFAPTQTGPFPAPTTGLASALLSLSPSAGVPISPLACVGNAASYVAGPVAPGEIATLFGSGLGPLQGVQTNASAQSPFPNRAAGVQVTFDGTPAPLLWVQATQINVAVPWSVAGPTTKICAFYNPPLTNVISMACLTWPVAQTAPGVFTTDGIHAAALNQDQTVNSASNPAPAGSIVSVFATGLGPIGPPQADGSLVESPLPANVLPVLLQPPCTGQVCLPLAFPVLYGGPAPSLIAGASQINFQAISSGLAVAVGQAASNGFRVYVAGQ